jgi:hypothetical protein
MSDKKQTELIPSEGPQAETEAVTETSLVGLPNGTDNPYVSIAQLAASHGQDIGEIVKAALEWDAHMAEKAFAEAFSAFQTECPQVARKSLGRIATKGGASRTWRYAELDEIEKTVGPIAHKHGLSWRFSAKAGDGWIDVQCEVLHVMGHREVTEYGTKTDSLAPMTEQHKYASALTQAQRRALSMALGLTMTDPDTDGIGVGACERITQDQAADLFALADEVGADLPAFLKWMRVRALADIPAAQFKRAHDALESKRK